MFWGGSFSNWYLSDFTMVIEDREITFNCVEQYMMYMKAINFDDRETAELIMNESNPKEQKKLGRKVKNFDSSKWRDICYPIVYNGVFEKFKQNSLLKRTLLRSKCEMFVEASPHDRIWGIGYDSVQAYKVDENKWGENLLGKIITEVREELQLNP